MYSSIKIAFISTLLFSCTSKHEPTNESSVVPESEVVEIIDSSFVINKIKEWKEKQIILRDKINGDMFCFLTYLNDSTFIDTPYDTLKFSIENVQNKVVITFFSKKSAIINEPSITKYTIHRFHKEIFYGTDSLVSPKYSIDNEYDYSLDTTILTEWDILQKEYYTQHDI